MEFLAGHRQAIMTGIMLATSSFAHAEVVTVDTVTEMLPGESQAQLVARVTPSLQDKALKTQNGTIARVTSDNGKRMDRQLKLIQGGIVSSTLLGVTPETGNNVRVAMSFDIDLKGGHEFAQLDAQNITMKAHMGELADAAATNPVSNSVLADMAKRKYQALTDLAATTATVRSGIATAALGNQLKQATSNVCNKRYDVASVSNIDIHPGMNDTIEASATVVVKGLVDDCQQQSFTLGAWLGQSRTMSNVSFKSGRNFGFNESYQWKADDKTVGYRIHTSPNDYTPKLKADMGARYSNIQWGYRGLTPLPDGTGVELNYFVSLPSSLVGPSDELIVKVVPGT